MDNGKGLVTEGQYLGRLQPKQKTVAPRLFQLLHQLMSYIHAQSLPSSHFISIMSSVSANFLRAVSLICFVSTGCSETVDKFGVPQVVSFSNRLAPKLLQAFAPGRENLVVAPFGFATNLAMVMEGVDKKTADDMASPLHLQTSSIVKQALRHGFKELFEEFEKGQQDEEVAGTYNRATIHSSLPLSPPYKDVLETFYRANVTQDIANATQQVLELQSDTGVMSHWKDYHKLAVYTYLSHQSAAPFKTFSGETISVPMIPQVGTFHVGYLPRLNSQAVELLLEAPRASLLLVMPDAWDSLDEVLLKLPNEKISTLGKTLPLTECEVSLPQLAIVSSNTDFKPFLEHLGLSHLFTSPAVKNTNKGLIKYIKQNAYFATSFVSVNSVGSSGIALENKTPSKRQKRKVSMKVEINKPFLFFLLHRPTGLVLLAGIVRKPTQVPN